MNSHESPSESQSELVMSDYYTLVEACELLKLSKKYLENYGKVGKELNIQKIGNRNKIAIDELNAWKLQREFGLVTLETLDYISCIEFAIRSFYNYSSTSDFGTSTLRDAGKFISNFAIGKLGEIAVKKFLKRNFDIEIALDFSLRDAVVGQDISEMARPRVGGRVYNPLRRRVAIKTTKMKNVWLIVPAKEVEDPDRKSDIYISVRADLFQDHLIRLLRDHSALENIKAIIPAFEDIPAEVCGFAYYDDISSVPAVEELPLQRQAIGRSYIMNTGRLNRTKSEWDTMLATL